MPLLLRDRQGSQGKFRKNTGVELFLFGYLKRSPYSHVPHGSLWKKSGKPLVDYREIGCHISFSRLGFGLAKRFSQQYERRVGHHRSQTVSPYSAPTTSIRWSFVWNQKNSTPGWSLTPSLQSGDLWKAYQEATVSAAGSQKGLRILIHFPVYEFPLSFQLCKVISLPKNTKTLRCLWHILPCPIF